MVCGLWRQPDSGIWEVRSEPAHFTQSKMMCWVALDRALDLANRGVIPGQHSPNWRDAAGTIREFIESQCWSAQRRSYVRSAGVQELDASLLLGVLHGYQRPNDRAPAQYRRGGPRRARRRPICSPLQRGGRIAGGEGAFVACSFWLAEALARAGRVEQAAELMDQLVPLANDVGLYARRSIRSALTSWATFRRGSATSR